MYILYFSQGPEKPLDVNEFPAPVFKNFTRLDKLIDKTLELQDTIPSELGFLVAIIWKAGKNFVHSFQRRMKKEEAIKYSINEKYYPENKESLINIYKRGIKSFELIGESRFSIAVEKISDAFTNFIDDTPTIELWKNKMQWFGIYLQFSLDEVYLKFLDPTKLKEHLSLLADQKDGIFQMMNALNFILMTECKFLCMMAHYNFYKDNLPAINQQFDVYNSHVEILNGIAKNLAITRIIPLGSNVSYNFFTNTV